ncbi:glycosyltransferase family 92 protein [Candidatus Villigracilis saccharophilus]|uniref:glycosyltransferase family 92 protein n=1 Tax=Candidatus Villigracilis saccharophilus TaxID=3140684 RepID=UPI0031357AC7|nr:glycosyltransferase family 92 protein [Anaerolineales bacterium]
MDYLSLCLICKDENDYLPEWLDYHILMGVDRFYIYDNESRVSLRESLKDYIDRSWVVVVDITGRAMQLSAYDHCLQNFGGNTFWMGFIDTDEFLVPKTTFDLKELLKEYEGFGGLAVSSVFFGSNGNQSRPAAGQIASYTSCVHEAFKEYEFVKSIVQPAQTLMPNSPHDFIYKKDAYCVNEGFLRVDGQRFPIKTEKIQLNHYYCRSEDEIDLKVRRGRGAMNAAWPRRRFDVINFLATYEELSILQKLDQHFQKANLDSSVLLTDPRRARLLENMSALTRFRYASELEIALPVTAENFRAEFSNMAVLRDQIQTALDKKDLHEAKRLMMLRLQMVPQIIILYSDLSSCLLDLGEPAAAWQMLSRAWQISPNNYVILGGMAFYFLRVKNFTMAESTCRLLLELAPHDMVALGMLTHSLLGQERFEEAIRIGTPVVELSAQVGELPDRMGVFLVKKMADYLLEKKDYQGAVSLWESGVKCQPDDLNALLELIQAMLLAGDRSGTLKYLTRAQELAPRNEIVMNLSRQANVIDH